MRTQFDSGPLDATYSNRPICPTTADGVQGYIGHLEIASQALYGFFGNTGANIAVGVLSAVIDNIPVMTAILNMNPDMNEFQWLLVCLTAAVGGSLLSIRSAAGVALMALSARRYTFFRHLSWSWVIALGYAASSGAHFVVNR